MPTHKDLPRPRFAPQKKAPPAFSVQTFYVALIGVAFLGYVAIDMIDVSASPVLSAIGAAVTPSCNIKGNVSINSRERIYHVPGQEYYADTKISPQYGERWFCSEAEARAAGWRRAGR